MSSGERPAAVIFDYGMGNLRSVANAFEALSATVLISSRLEDLVTAQRIVLPGVGAFGEAMRRLRASDAVPCLRSEVLEKRKPFLGICLGMQLLADRSFEHGEHDGLGWIGGEVHRIVPEDASLRVPHIGWNEVKACRQSAMLGDLPAAPSFYFVHSYHFLVKEADHVVGTCDYGSPLTAAVQAGHIWGTQFHPEKSQKAGLGLLRNFLAAPTTC
jgi:glutamine amidotransferase